MCQAEDARIKCISLVVGTHYKIFITSRHTLVNMCVAACLEAIIVHCGMNGG